MNKKEKNKSRREFLKKSMTGAVGLSLFPSVIKGKKKEEIAKANNKKKLIYRTLGRTGIRVPVVSLGATNPNVTKAALDAGITYLDTAHRYGSGSHETMLGGVLKGRPRDSFIIATKITTMVDYKTGLLFKNITPAEFKADFNKKMELSLKRLQLDYVDILYLHGLNNPQLAREQSVKDHATICRRSGPTGEGHCRPQRF